jgi:WD40 repeat protein
MSPQKLTLRSAVSPITAVAFLSPIYILAGESHCINVFAASDGICSVKTSSKKKRIFSRNRVHGIVVSQCNQHVLFWGGRSIGVYPRDAVITIVDDDNDEDEEWRERESVAPDWVLSAAFLSDDCRRVVAVGAHNSLFVYDCVSRRWDNTSGASIEERTMLYSADLAVSTDGVCVAAGTVFGEIIVWDWWREAKTGVVKRRFRGHEGSVFAVRLCRQNWVASCSDDRTVRVWDLSCGEPVLPPTGQEVGEAKSTGFVETHGGKGCVALGWGHQARPWGVRFLDPDGGSTFDEVRLISVSEDLTTRFWSFVPKPGLTVEMKNTHTWKLHSGKHIWSFALDPDTQRMATGGNDGRVVLLDYSDDVEIQEEWVFEEVMEMVSSSTLQPDREPEKQPYMQMQKKKKKNKPRDAFKNYAMLDQDRFVVSTVFGHVLAYNMKTKIWKSLGKWEELMNWSAIDSWDGACLVALGDSKGNLGILDINREREWWWDAGGKGKVTGVFVGSKYGGVFSFALPLPAMEDFVFKILDRFISSYYNLITMFHICSALVSPARFIFSGTYYFSQAHSSTS